MEQYAMRAKVLWERCWSVEDAILTENLVNYAIDYFKLGKGKLEVLMDEDIESGSIAEAVRVSKNKFMIVLSKNMIDSDESLAKTIFHEMTHIKQYMQDGFKIGAKKVSWQGKKFSVKSEKDYWLSPWEMEARAMEEALLRFWEIDYEKRGS
jgi:hypothetical protein